MKLEAIFEEWSKDCKIDPSKIDSESLKTGETHAKYLKAYTKEKLIYRALEAEAKELKLAKYEFYTQGQTEETRAKGWELPPIGKVLKSEVNTYMDADKHLIEMNLRLGHQKEKLELLEGIIDQLNKRGFAIRAYIDWQKFSAGY